MKKTLFTIVALLTLGLSQMYAQVEFSYGAKVNANLSNFILSDMDGADSNMKAGASLGGFVKLDFCENFALQSELMFHYKSSELEILNWKSDYEYWGVEIPVYAVGQMGLWNGRGYVGLGPYVSCGFSAKYKKGDVDLYDKDLRNRWDFGAGVMLGYEFPFGLQINAGYQIGFIDNLDAGKDDASMNNQSISLGVGYRF